MSDPTEYGNTRIVPVESEPTRKDYVRMYLDTLDTDITQRDSITNLASPDGQRDEAVLGLNKLLMAAEERITRLEREREWLARHANYEPSVKRWRAYSDAFTQDRLQAAREATDE